MANLQKVTPTLGTPRICKGCQVEYPRSRKAAFCSRQCQRRYFAERFDRWIANPEFVALPQNFDEFLARVILTCPIAGCEWEGESLGTHVNYEHGVTARNFKKLCGFNLKTGLIGQNLSESMAAKAKRLLAEGVWTAGVPAGSIATKPESYVSLEAKEHARKTRAELPAFREVYLNCKSCGVEVQQPYLGQRLYCSTACRSKFYGRKAIADLRCAYCGGQFTGSRAQARRSQKALPVCCSEGCRNRLNVTAALAARGID